MLQSISYKLMTRIFTQNVFLCIPLKKRSFYRRLFCWSVVQALSAQYLLTPLLENLVQWKMLMIFRSRVQRSRSKCWVCLLSIEIETVVDFRKKIIPIAFWVTQNQTTGLYLRIVCLIFYEPFA